ncbi:DoxX family protein [Micromonospora sp. DT47]|uniref:DoxX family protein n=1 Tax=Micromonospora sp. DT47 TaxID=3393431 RepID=UPI003CEE55B6
MPTAYIMVTLLAAAMAGFSAASVFFRAKWVVVEPLADYGVPRSWWPWLGTAKAAGAAGLVAGLFVPVIGVMAAIGLVLYFAGAVVTVVRARSYWHTPFPLLYVAPVVGTLPLGFAA